MATPIGQPLRIGTRGSPLARWQAEWVAGRLAAAGVAVDLIPISTQGDRETRTSIGSLGVQGAFTKELQYALLDSRIDLAVHSLKDLPTEPVEGLTLAAVPERESSADVIVSRNGAAFFDLFPGAKIGTGSLRRQAQLLAARPDLTMHDIRGNVDTRLRKLAEGQYDALVLAEAGLRRLELAEHITQVLPKSVMLPAVGQGALGLEARVSDAATRALLVPLDDAVSHAAVLAERALLAALRGGCLAPVGAWSRSEAPGRLTLSGVVLARDGSRRLDATASGSLSSPEPLGQEVAASLIAQGAFELIAAARAVS